MVGDELARTTLLEGKFRVAVKIAPDRHERIKLRALF
jgi:hypothetical protein